MEMETVAIVWKDGGKAWINRADFDPSKHVLWTDEETAPYDGGESDPVNADEPAKRRGRPPKAVA